MKPGYYVRRIGPQGGRDPRDWWISSQGSTTQDREKASIFPSARAAGHAALEFDQVVQIATDGLESQVWYKATSGRLVPLRAAQIEDLRVEDPPQASHQFSRDAAASFRRWSRPRRNYVPPIGGRGPDGQSAWSTPPSIPSPTDSAAGS